MTDREIQIIFDKINARRFGPPSSWSADGRPIGWHLARPCTPTDAANHDNGINDALIALTEAVWRDAE